MIVSKKHFLFIFILILNTASAQSVTRKVLFLGNSYTDVNNLPQITADFATSMGDTLLFDKYTPGGYTLDLHSTDSISRNKIIAGGWDYVVMQEQSQLPAFDVYFSQGARSLRFLTEEYNPCARKMFYMTWGRKNGDASNCAVWPPICTYEGMDSLLRLRYIEMAIFNNAEVSPVGAVWRYLRQNFPAIELYQPDESHPSAAGSYAAACCFYSMLFRKDPTLSSYNYVLNSIEATTIRNAAKIIVYDSLQYWDFTDNIPVPDFTYTIGTGINEVIFSNFSDNADNYSWDFGDGQFSNALHPVHNYAANGLYTITLTATNCDFIQSHQATYQSTVNFCSHNPTIDPDSLVDCPAIEDTLWTQVYDSYQWYGDGGIILPNDTNQYILPIPGNFTYSVMTTSNNCSELSPEAYVQPFSNGMVFYFLDSISTTTHQDTICMGDTVYLIVFHNKPMGPDHYFEWYENGIHLTSATDDTLLITSSGNYCFKVFNSQYCQGYAFYNSDTLSLNFINCNIGIDEYDPGKFLTIYPNPAGEYFHLTVNPELIGQNFSINDITGRKLLSGTLNSEKQIFSVIDFKNGIYFFETNLNGKQISSKLNIVK